MEMNVSCWGWQPGFLESKLPFYGILARTCEVNALFIGFKKSRFFQIHFAAQSPARRGRYDTSFMS